MGSRIGAIVLIFVLTTIAWFILGGTIFSARITPTERSVAVWPRPGAASTSSRRRSRRTRGRRRR
jgi:hypothetical protein